ncbi:unnamed protein product [Effrenium voratum]|nr:unnamed protein product [Effrenium voratum]
MVEAEELKDALNAARQAQLLLKDADTASKAKVEEILDRLRVHEFRVDEAPSARATYGGFDPRLAAMMPAMVSGPDPATVRATIQEVTRKMVGKEDDVEADMPLMDIGRAQPPSKSQHPVNVWLEKMAAMENRALMWQADLDQELRRLQAEVKAVAQLAEQVEQPDLEEKLSLFRFEVEKIRQFLVEVLQLLLDRKQKDQELQRREEALKLWEQRLEAAPKAKELERREAALNLWEQRLQRQEAAKPAAKTKPKQRVKEAAKEEPKAKRRAQYLTFEERRWAWLREAALQAAPQEDLPEEDEDELFLALTAPAPPAHKVNEQLEPVSSTAAPELESQAQETEDANPRSEELGEAASLSGQEKARAKKKDWYLRHFPGAVAPREAPIPRFERPKGRGRGKAHPRGVSTRPPRPREEWAYRPLKRRCAAQFQGLLQDYLQLERLPRVDEVLPALCINSMNAVLFRNKLTSEFADIQLPTTLVFDYPTVKALSSLVVEQTSAAAAAANQAAMAAMPAFPTALGAMGGAMAPVRADPAIITSKIQEVTKGMVGSSGDIDADMPLMDIGINSMNAVLFRNKLGSTFEGVELPSTLVFDFPTIRAMTDLLSQLTEQ